MGDAIPWAAAMGPGGRGSLDQFFAELYRELRSMAHSRLRRHKTSTLLDTTALVHESYLRFLKTGQIQIGDRPRFLAYAARVMRSVIVDFARESSAARRGGNDVRVTLNPDADVPALSGEAQILRVHEALEQLATVNERLVSVVEMRYFGGMNEAEIAEALGVTERTVRRDWEKARMILITALK